MAYAKQTWQTGEVITAEKLNNLERGIEGAYVALSWDENFYLVHDGEKVTCQQVISFFENRVPVFLCKDGTVASENPTPWDSDPMISAVYHGDKLEVCFLSTSFAANTPIYNWSIYPLVFTQEDGSDYLVMVD